jgi:hypothetical protein
MQAKVNISHTDSRGSFHNLISRLFQRFGGRVPTLLAALVICLLGPIGYGTSVAQTPASATTQSDAQKIFEKIKTLSGSWQGTIMGIPIDITIRAASSGTAILHEGTTEGGRPPNHEITMFYLEEDRLLATHYCDGGNRVRWEGKLSPDGKSIEFSFLDVVGGTRGGLLKRMAFIMIDVNHHTIEGTFIMPDGKPVQMRGEFQRTK